jgi:ElaB/YqjD/DUF883 family membrane-anchored ribosome-binding protein
MPRQSNRSNTADEIAKLKEDVAQLARQLANVADSAADGALDEVRAQAMRVKGAINDVLGQAGDEAAEAVREVRTSLTESLEETVHRHPLTTLSVALLMGFVAGALWRR